METPERSGARAEPRRVVQAVGGLRGTPVLARTRGQSRAEARAEARAGVSGAAKLPSRSASTGSEELRSQISPLPCAGHVHRSQAAAAAGAGEHVPTVFLLHPGAQETPPPPPLPLPRGLLMSRRCSGTADAGTSLSHGSGLLGCPQTKPPLPLSLKPAHKHTHAGLGRGQFRLHRVPRSRTGADVARPRHRAQQPSLPGECPAPRLRTTVLSLSHALP